MIPVLQSKSVRIKLILSFLPKITVLSNSAVFNHKQNTIIYVKKLNQTLSIFLMFGCNYIVRVRTLLNYFKGIVPNIVFYSEFTTLSYRIMISWLTSLCQYICVQIVHVTKLLKFKATLYIYSISTCFRQIYM